MTNPPKSLEEARAYRYNRWAGNPSGNDYFRGKCSYEVHDSFSGFYQCSRKAKHGPAGLYCKQHAKIIEGE